MFHISNLQYYTRVSVNNPALAWSISRESTTLIAAILHDVTFVVTKKFIFHFKTLGYKNKSSVKTVRNVLLISMPAHAWRSCLV